MPDKDADYAKGGDGAPRTLEMFGEEGDARRFSPSIGRNRQVVAEAVHSLIPDDATVLEVGSGTGEHGVYITEDRPQMNWMFTEYAEEAWPSIKAWLEHAGRVGLHGPLKLDAASANWGDQLEAMRYDAIFSANVIHISGFAVAEGILAGASRVLTTDGLLLLYGPFGRNGVLSEGNADFDADLKRRNPDWGVRDLEREIIPLAEASGLQLAEVIDMPKTNLTVAFKRV